MHSYIFFVKTPIFFSSVSYKFFGDFFKTGVVSNIGFYNILSSIFIHSKFLNISFNLKNSLLIVDKINLNICIIFWVYFLNMLYLLNFFMFNFYKKFIYIVSVGLGFRRKRRIRRGGRFFELYMGNRHRVAFAIPKMFYVIMFRRGNIIFFSNSKNSLYHPILCFRNFRKELAFKFKGFFLRRKRMTKRLSRIWAFARRVRFKGVRLKLSKKQKLL